MTSESECSSTETMERMQASLSHMRACSGKCSQICTPGTLVSIGLNSPRNSVGRVGLEVVHVHVRRAAGQVDHDGGLWPGRRWPAGHGRVRPASRSMSASVRPAPNAPILQEVAAADAVAETLLRTPEGQHVIPPYVEDTDLGSVLILPLDFSPCNRNWRIPGKRRKPERRSSALANWRDYRG